MSILETNEVAVSDGAAPDLAVGDGAAPVDRRIPISVAVTNAPEAWPRGWYFVCFGDALQRGSVRKVRMFGVDWAVFRTRSGKIGVVDAVCRHLGADLGAAGKVKGERLQCGYHGWQFGCDGVCEVAPRTDRIPQAARQLPLPVLEHLGNVWVWYGDGAPEPFPSMGEADDPDLYVTRSGHTHESTGDCRTLLEHASDSYHFRFKHYINVNHVWAPKIDDGFSYGFDWNLAEGERAHPLWRFIRTKGHVRFAGPCTAVYRVLPPGAADDQQPSMAFVLTVTPVEEGRTLFSWRILVRKIDRRRRFALLNRAITALVWQYFRFNIGQDLGILRTMRRVDHPVWVRADGGSIRAYRAYYDRNLVPTPTRWPAPRSPRSQLAAPPAAVVTPA
jgi:phenylpropionate dioxygenase-like ring-hydroxylating dioxygenase large terminal subunit